MHEHFLSNYSVTFICDCKMAKDKKDSPHFQTDLTLIRSVPAREEWITKKTQKRFTPNYHTTINRTCTHTHTNADWTPTDHYHWWHMIDLFNWSLIANDVMDRKMNMHWSRAARYDRRKRHYKAFSIESFKSCTVIYRLNICNITCRLSWLQVNESIAKPP